MTSPAPSPNGKRIGYRAILTHNFPNREMLVLSVDEFCFSGFQPQVALELTYFSQSEGSNGLCENQSEYFIKIDEAVAAFEFRRDSDDPKKDSGKSLGFHSVFEVG